MAIKHIPFLIIAFLSGVALRSFFDVQLQVILVLIGIAAGLLIINYFFGFGAKFLVFHFLFLILLMFLLGILRLSFFENKITEDQLHKHYGQNLTLQGTVLSSKQRAKSSSTILETDLGKLLVIAGVYPEFKYGDILEVTGEILEPEPYGNFDTKKHLAKDLIFSQMLFPDIKTISHVPKSKILSFLFGVKDKFEENLRKILPEPHASLADGMLLGNEGVLDASLLDAFRKSGTIHILVLSGFNITIVGAFFLFVFGSIFPAMLSGVIVALGIATFTLMTGAEPPAVRAAIMAIIGLIALRTGRRQIAMLALFWSAFFMVLVNPMLLRWDGSFQLSFLATLGLIVASPWFVKKLSFLPKYLMIREITSATLSAQLFVVPLLFSWGSEISVLSPLANVLIVGLVPHVMFFGFVGGLFAFLSTFLGRIVGSASYLLISFQIFVAETISNISGTILFFNLIPPIFLIFIYSLLFYWAYRVYVKSI